MQKNSTDQLKVFYDQEEILTDGLRYVESKEDIQKLVKELEIIKKNIKKTLE